MPIAFDSSVILAPVFSHKADKLFIDDIHRQLCIDLDNSDDHTMVVNIFRIQFE